MKKNKNADSSIRSLYSKKLIKKIDSKINLLGITCNYNAISFLNIRLITSIILFILVLSF